MKPIHTIIVLLFLNIQIFSNELEKLKIGTKEAPPFVIKNDDGTFSGITIEIWNEISSMIEVEYEIEEYSLRGLVEAVEEKRIDVAVSPLTVTSEREKIIDFSHPYFISGLSIATIGKGGSGWLDVTKRMFSYDFIEAIGFLILLLFVVGFLVWLFERKKNSDQFGNDKTNGLLSSFWFAAVTMTTVGYGDKAPITTGGRLIALVWMFVAIIIISSITAAITSALTVSQLQAKVNSLNDLYNVKVGTVSNSSAEKFLTEKGINTILFETPESCVEGLNNSIVDAIVYDTPILKYLIKSKNYNDRLTILPSNIKPEYYAFAFNTGSKLRERINPHLISIINTKRNEELLERYFGN